MNRSPSIFLLLAAWATAASAQTPDESFFDAGFERDMNRYRWTSEARFDAAIADWHAVVVNRYLSEAYQLGGSVSDFRDEENARWSIERNGQPRLSGRSFGRLLWYSLSNTITGDTYGGVRMMPHKALTLEPAIGFAVDRRPGPTAADGSVPLRTDAGPAFFFQADWKPPALDEYRIGIQSDANMQFITPRRTWRFRNTATVVRQFNRTAVSIEAGYINVRRDSYQAASFLNRTEPVAVTSETIEATSNDTLLTTLRVVQPIRTHWQFDMDVTVTNHRRFIRTLRAPRDALFFDTDFERRVLDTNLSLLRRRGDELFRLSLASGANVERRQLANRAGLPPAQAVLKGSLLRQADFDRGALSLRVQWNTAPSPRVSFAVAGSANIVRHDTPEENFDDRDEVYHNAEAGVQLHLSRYLQADIRVIGTLYHTVYLNAVRSGENNIQRAIRLRPGVRWNPSDRTRIRFISEVRSTYTVDDFELPETPRNDQSARERRYVVDLEHDIGAGRRVLLESSVSDLHLGRLLWDRFAEIPFDTLRTWSLWPRIRAGTGWTAELGVRAFVRRDYDPRVTIQYRPDPSEALERSVTRPGRQWIEQWGPTCAVAAQTGDGSVVRLEGWLQFQRIRQRLFGGLPPEDKSQIVGAARRGKSNLIPHLSIAVRRRF